MIPYMDALTEHLDTFSQDELITPAVHMAAKRGRIILDKYYGLTDETIIYRIAMSKYSFVTIAALFFMLTLMHYLEVLHPRYKINYFRTQEWPEDWITEAMDLIRGEWTSRYKPAAPSPSAQAKGKDHASGPSSRTPGPGRRSAAAAVCHRFLMFIT